MLALENLHKRFGDVRALDGCTFTVRPGTIFGFLGPNGAGKTTAMRIIFGLLNADEGEVTWQGKEIGMAELFRFGYMPEQRGLYPKMKTHDQIVYLATLHGLSRMEAGSKADAWLEEFGLAERRMDPVESLSHGNQQRVQLIASLVHEPELLVLDEPFSGLDPMAVDTMSGILRRQAAAGKAVVFSSHQLDLVEDLCEEVAIVNAGRVVVEGDVKRLKDASPLRHLEVEVEGDISPFLSSLGEITSHRSSNSHHYLTIGADADIDEFIRGAQGLGRIRHFSYTSPSLNELFREAVR